MLKKWFIGVFLTKQVVLQSAGERLLWAAISTTQQPLELPKEVTGIRMGQVECQKAMLNLG